MRPDELLDRAWAGRGVVAASSLVLLSALAITGIYYLAARLVFPHDRKEWPDYDVYYFAHKHWVIGGVLLSNLLLTSGQIALGFSPLATHFQQALALVFYAEGLALILLRSRRWSIALLVFWLLQYPGTAIYVFAR